MTRTQAVDDSRVEDPGGAPRSVRAASATLALQGLVLAGLVAATVTSEETLVRAWADDSPAARDLVATGGLDALERSTVAVPAFVPIAVVSFLTIVPLGAVLAAMLRHRAPWVRSWLTALAGFGAVTAALAVRTEPPAVFAGLALLAGLSCVVLILCLWHPATSRWLARST